MTKRKPLGMEEKYGMVIPLRLEAKDAPKELRKFVSMMCREVAALIIKQWSSDVATYDVDIRITMTKREDD